MYYVPCPCKFPFIYINSYSKYIHKSNFITETAQLPLGVVHFFIVYYMNHIEIRLFGHMGTVHTQTYTLDIWISQILRVMGIHSGETTQSKLLCLPSEEQTPFQKGVGVQLSNQEATKSCLPCKNGGKLSDISSQLQKRTAHVTNILRICAV